MRFHAVRFLTLLVSAAMIALVGWVGVGTATAAPLEVDDILIGPDLWSPQCHGKMAFTRGRVLKF